MSYLARPRLHFWGKALVNTVTSNNRTHDWKLQPYYDPVHSRLDLGDKTPEVFREWMHQLNYEGYVNALWNYYGDNGVRLVDTKINSVELEDGRLLSDSKDDSLIGSDVQLFGTPYRDRRAPAVLVDLDPTDGFTTQLFAQFFQINDANGSFLEANAPVRTHSRWINSWRNLQFAGDRGSSAVWQLAFPKESLKFSDNQSPSLQAFSKSMEAGQGIVIRLCFYLFQHLPYKEIAKAYANKERVPMPGQMIISGTIGVWGMNEPASMPAARILMPNPSSPIDIPDTIKSERRLRQFFLGVTLAEVDTSRKIVTLDLVNSIPESTGFDTLTDDLSHLAEKVNLGDLSLQIIDPISHELYCVGVIPFESSPAQEPCYHKADTLLRGGIIEMPYPPELEDQIINGDLALMQGAMMNSPVLLRENPYHLLIDERNIYFELEDPNPKEIVFQVLKRGKVLNQPMVIRIEQTISHGGIGGAYIPEGDVLQSTGAHSQEREQEEIGQEGLVDIASEIRIDTKGLARLSIRPLQAGMAKLWLYSPTDPDLSQIVFGTNRYFLLNEIQYSINVRILPDDSHYDLVADAELTWEYMQEHFFRYYSLLYPMMNEYINFDDKTATQAQAGIISAFVSEALFNSTIYMPITRELSAGKRRLVQRWASLQR